MYRAGKLLKVQIYWEAVMGSRAGQHSRCELSLLLVGQKQDGLRMAYQHP